MKTKQANSHARNELSERLCTIVRLFVPPVWRPLFHPELTNQIVNGWLQTTQVDHEIESLEALLSGQSGGQSDFER